MTFTYNQALVNGYDSYAYQKLTSKVSGLKRQFARFIL